MNNHAAYIALLEEAIHSGGPSHYQDDLLVHDKSSIEEMDPGQPFGWLVRESGTWIIHPWGTAGESFVEWDQKGPGAILGYCIKYEGDPKNRAYYWDGQQLIGMRTLKELRKVLMYPGHIWKGEAA